MPCGHGVGNGGLQPLLLALVPLHQVTMVEAGSWKALGAEVKTVLSREEKLLSPPAHWPPQDENEELSVGAGMPSRCLYPVGSTGQKMSPA